MIKYVVQVRDNYDYKILQLDLLMVVNNNVNTFIVDRASYDAHASAVRAAGTRGYHHNRIWKVPVQFRGRNCTIPDNIVFDTREDAALAAISLVEDKIRRDILQKKKDMLKMEEEIKNLSSKTISSKGKFHNCSTLDMKKNGKKKP